MLTTKSYFLKGIKPRPRLYTRPFVLLSLFISLSIISFSQSTYKLKADSVKISNDAANTELILENSTKNVNGFLYNKGNGRTEFRKAMVKLNDSVYLFGVDTLRLQMPVLFSKAVSFQSPTASENVSLWYTPVAVTITQIAESVRGTSPSITYNVRYASTRDAGSPTAVFSSDRAVTSTSGTTVSTFANASVPAGSWIWITTSAASGAINDFNATIIYRQ